jgi:CheY-like chemotaxis protein
MPEQTAKIEGNFYPPLTWIAQLARVFDESRETIVDVDIGRACVTHSFGIWQRAMAADNRGRTPSSASPWPEPDSQPRLPDLLLEVLRDLEPDGPSAPRTSAGMLGTAAKPRAITILLVDDDTIDVIAVRRSFSQLKIASPLAVARNGIEALDVLHGRNGQEKVTAPYLVLLDLNMPCMGGLEFLSELRNDPVLRRALVFVMTASGAEADRERAYEKNVAGYVVKPPPGQDFTQVVSALENYWRAIELPD